MSTWATLLLAGAAGIGTIGLLAGVLLLATGSPDDADRVSRATSAPEDHPGSSSAQTAGPSRQAAEHIWPSTWTHDAPEQPLTADEAHHEMQVHRTCRLDGCARKAAAFQTLIEAGRVTPDTSRQPY